MRQLIEYDFVRTKLRENKPLVFTLKPFQSQFINMAEFAFDDRRARMVYGCSKLAEFVERTTVQKLMELYKDRNFKNYCIDIYNKHQNKKLYQQSQALQTKQNTASHEIQDPSKTYPQILIGKLNVEKQTDALEVEIDNVFIPLQAIKVLT